MSQPTTDPSPAQDARDPDDRVRDDEAAEPVLPGDERRGIGEWAIVLVLVALIVGVAWSQFGPLFDTSTAGSDGAPPPQGLTVEGEGEGVGVVVGGTAMSHLVDPGPGATEPSDERDTQGAHDAHGAGTPDE
ncbi:MAG: hypothetical protein H6726_18955 [Sandaracinaceae bacterium]|nr:hypothetical protein [Sandaracinaceae bacterium]